MAIFIGVEMQTAKLDEVGNGQQDTEVRCAAWYRFEEYP
jgi:hypothetical protein